MMMMTVITRSGGNCDALPLEGRPTLRQSFSAVPRVRRNWQ